MTSDHHAYGVKEGRAKHISEVQRGLACGCACAHCGRPLVAKKGTIRDHHFAHHEPTECQGGAETLLHLLAKELIGELPNIHIPPYKFTPQRTTPTGVRRGHTQVVANGGIVQIDAVRTEESEAGFRPDIVIESRGKQLLVEIAVFHKVEKMKLRKLRRRNLPAIEIRLSPNEAFSTRDQLREKLQRHLASKHWLFHPAQKPVEAAFYESLRRSRSLERTQAPPEVEHGHQERRSRKFVTASFVKGQVSLAEYDRRCYSFFERHGRGPSEEEDRRLWAWNA